MKITIDLCAGGSHRPPTKRDMEKNIKALSRVLNKEPSVAFDDTLLLDTKSILRAIMEQLPE